MPFCADASIITINRELEVGSGQNPLVEGAIDVSGVVRRVWSKVVDRVKQ
ncbi:MAG: hypothetical protein GDA56_10995 [Hormoscilla sp. GM7CHS1pb]|nr:hypothetical protein [Hormoscilla sp. GM7CHS1pb]